MGRETSDPDSDFPRAVAALEEAVHDLLAGGWEEARRRRARDLAVALAQATRFAARKEPLEKLSLLLALTLPEVVPIRRALREKLLDLLESLKDSPSSAESA